MSLSVAVQHTPPSTFFDENYEKVYMSDILSKLDPSSLFLSHGSAFHAVGRKDPYRSWDSCVVVCDDDAAVICCWLVVVASVFTYQVWVCW